MKTQLIFPMAFYALYIWCLGILVFRSRAKAIRSGEVSIKYFRIFEGQPPAERTVVLGRHYDNQFQVPMLFFAAGILHIIVGLGGIATLTLAWLFVAFRLWHSWIHLGSNRIQKRAAAFVASWLMVALLWIQLVYFAIQQL